VSERPAPSVVDAAGLEGGSAHGLGGGPGGGLADGPANKLADGPRAISVAVMAMGGEGGGVLADWLVDLAEHDGWIAQATSVPGVAQRTGATIYYIELFPGDAARRAGAEPVLALMPTPGEVDVVIASELMEAGRAVQRGLVTPARTTFIASTHRVYSMTEKTAMGDGRVDADSLLRAAASAAHRFVAADFGSLADAAGSVIGAALFGALAGTAALPFARERFESAIRRGGVGVSSSLAAFESGFAAALAPVSSAGAHVPVSSADAHVPSAQASTRVAPVPHAAPASRAAGTRVGPRLAPLAARIEQSFPAAAHEVLRAGVVRLADYQDIGYAVEFLDRLAPLLQFEHARGPADPELLRETARHLALWMSYEDTIRVADLKTRRSRFERVGGEVRLAPGQLLGIAEFMHPRVEEIADTLPAGLGRWLLGSGPARRFVGRFTRTGRTVRTSSVRGYLLLYGVASLRRWRRATLRFAGEHARIDAWLRAIVACAAHDYPLAVEIARCQRLVKGYGDTHQRGSRSFGRLLAALPVLRQRPDAARRLAALAQAALADEHGVQLDAALQRLAADGPADPTASPAAGPAAASAGPLGATAAG
jgi:indolepyruvate ferredoxin oxidoreductase beta subunit